MSFIPIVTEWLEYKIKQAESLVLSVYSLKNNMNNTAAFLMPHVHTMDSCIKNSITADMDA